MRKLSARLARLRIRYHEWWMGMHWKAAEDARREAELFDEVESYAEAERLRDVADREYSHLVRHEYKSSQLFDIAHPDLMDNLTKWYHDNYTDDS